MVWTEQMDGTLGVGTSFRQSVRHPFGFTVSADYRVTVFELRMLVLVAISGGPLRPTETFELAENATGSTTLRCTIE